MNPPMSLNDKLAILHENKWHIDEIGDAKEYLVWRIDDNKRVYLLSEDNHPFLFLEDAVNAALNEHYKRQWAIRYMFSSIAEDWDNPDMDVYNDL